jgi:hypothetical protein
MVDAGFDVQQAKRELSHMCLERAFSRLFWMNALGFGPSSRFDRGSDCYSDSY